MDAEQARTLLADAGFDAALQNARIEKRDDRWAVSLSDDRMAWFPMSSNGKQRLEAERRTLQLFATRCSFQVPRVLFIAEAGWDIRALVPGVCEPWALYERVQHDRPLARRIGRSLGSILAEQHTRVHVEDTAGWLPHRLRWPEPWEWIEDRLPHVLQDVRLLRSIKKVRRRCQEEEGTETGSVLVHGDLGFHNIAIEPQTDAVQGVFDYDGAAWTDRHYDFRYFIFDQQGEDLLDAALEVYEPAVGAHLDRARIRLLNAACAISYLAFRCGTPPEVRSCGRTLAKDLRWVSHALRAIGEAPE